MHSYSHHIGDFAKATRGLTLTERGAYRELLDQYYAHESALPLDKRERYRLAGAVTAAERVAVDYVIGKYFSVAPDGMHQRRADSEIAAHRVRQAKASTAAGKRWSGEDARTMRAHAPSTATRMRTHAPSNARPMLDACSADAGVDARPMPAFPIISNNGSVTSTEDAGADWLRDEQSVVAKGKSVSIEARPGETWQQLRARILRALAARKGRNGAT